MDMVLTSSAGLPELNLIRRWSASLNHGSPLFLKGNMNKKAKILVCKAKKKTPIEGLSEEMNVIASQNMDFASARRRVRSAFMDVQQQLDHCLFKVLFVFEQRFRWDLEVASYKSLMLFPYMLCFPFIWTGEQMAPTGIRMEEVRNDDSATVIRLFVFKLGF